MNAGSAFLSCLEGKGDVILGDSSDGAVPSTDLSLDILRARRFLLSLHGRADM